MESSNRRDAGRGGDERRLGVAVATSATPAFIHEERELMVTLVACRVVHRRCSLVDRRGHLHLERSPRELESCQGPPEVDVEMTRRTVDRDGIGSVAGAYGPVWTEQVTDVRDNVSIAGWNSGPEVEMRREMLRDDGEQRPLDGQRGMDAGKWGRESRRRATGARPDLELGGVEYAWRGSLALAHRRHELERGCKRRSTCCESLLLQCLPPQYRFPLV